MPNTFPSQNRSLSGSASVTRSSGFRRLRPKGDPETLQNHPTTMPTAGSENQTEGAPHYTNDNEYRPRTWEEARISFWDCSSKELNAGIVMSETKDRAEWLKGVLHQHTDCWDAACKLADEERAAAKKRTEVARKCLESFSEDTFGEGTGDGAQYMIDHQISQDDQEARANSYLRGQAEGNLLESELPVMDEELAKKSVSTLHLFKQCK